MKIIKTRGTSKLLRAHRARIDIIFDNSSEVAKRRTSYKVGRIERFILNNKWTSLFLRVRYLPGSDNSGTYNNPTDAIDMLHAFTEDDLLNYVYR